MNSYTVHFTATIFNWLLALSALSTLFTWLSICLCHIRFRQAWKLQGHSVEELPFRAAGGTLSSSRSEARERSLTRLRSPSQASMGLGSA